MTGIPASIGAQLLARGEGFRAGVMAPTPHSFITELARRGIRVEERIEEQGIIDSCPADALSQGHEMIF
jgi:saccharopine dehydrogenase-like NADP-dependent oxidoreductase